MKSIEYSSHVRTLQSQIFFCGYFSNLRKAIRSGKRLPEDFQCQSLFFDDFERDLNGLSRIRMPGLIQADWDARALHRVSKHPAAAGKKGGRL